MNPSPNPDRPTDLATSLATSLGGRTFLSSDVNGHILVDGTRIQISFQVGSVNVNAGCNGLAGSASYDGATLVVGDLMQTLMACQPELEAQDAWLGELLRSRPTLQLDGDTLTVTSADTTITLVDRVVADPDRPIVGTVWNVDGLISGDAASSVPSASAASITITDGNAAVHTGCNRGSASVEITDDTITFGPLATTKMACAPELMDLEFAVTRVLDGEVTYSIEADHLTISTHDADGVAIGLTLRAE